MKKLTVLALLVLQLTGCAQRLSTDNLGTLGPAAATPTPPPGGGGGSTVFASFNSSIATFEFDPSGSVYIGYDGDDGGTPTGSPPTTAQLATTPADGTNYMRFDYYTDLNCCLAWGPDSYSFFMFIAGAQNAMNLSAYTKIRFWARSQLGGEAILFRLNTKTPPCAGSPNRGTMAQTFNPTTSWVQYTFDMSNLAAWTVAPAGCAFNTATVNSMDFISTTYPENSYLDIDAIELLP